MLRLRRARALERRDRRARSSSATHDRQVPRGPRARQARAARPRPGRGAGLRGGSRAPRGPRPDAQLNASGQLAQGIWPPSCQNPGRARAGCAGRNDQGEPFLMPEAVIVDAVRTPSAGPSRARSRSCARTRPPPTSSTSCSSATRASIPRRSRRSSRAAACPRACRPSTSAGSSPALREAPAGDHRLDRLALLRLERSRPSARRQRVQRRPGRHLHRRGRRVVSATTSAPRPPAATTRTTT